MWAIQGIDNDRQITTTKNASKITWCHKERLISFNTMTAFKAMRFVFFHRNSTPKLILIDFKCVRGVRAKCISKKELYIDWIGLSICTMKISSQIKSYRLAIFWENWWGQIGSKTISCSSANIRLLVISLKSEYRSMFVCRCVCVCVYVCHGSLAVKIMRFDNKSIESAFAYDAASTRMVRWYFICYHSVKCRWVLLNACQIRILCAHWALQFGTKTHSTRELIIEMWWRRRRLQLAHQICCNDSIPLRPISMN